MDYIEAMFLKSFRLLLFLIYLIILSENEQVLLPNTFHATFDEISKQSTHNNNLNPNKFKEE